MSGGGGWGMGMEWRGRGGGGMRGKGWWCPERSGRGMKACGLSTGGCWSDRYSLGFEHLVMVFILIQLEVEAFGRFSR